MSIGDKENILGRLIRNLPKGWFGDLSNNLTQAKESYPNLYALLNAFAVINVYAYSLYIYDKLQTRIKTATDDNLDLISLDFFGGDLPRRPNESDDSFRKRILATLLQEKATRRGLKNALKLLTGLTPVLFEPWYPPDCGGYNVATMMGYGIAGSYGSGSFAYQGFADVYVAPGSGMSDYGGFNNVRSAYTTYGQGQNLYYGSDSLVSTTITDNDIYQTINLTKAFGTIVWVRIHRGEVPPN